MESQEITERVMKFIRDKFLDGDPQGELDENTPLLTLGVINSLNVMQIVTHIRNDLGVVVTSMEVNGDNFKNVRAITSLILGHVNA
jgi:acyl carrier protein